MCLPPMLGGGGDNAQAVRRSSAPVGDAGSLSDPRPTLSPMPETSPDGASPDPVSKPPPDPLRDRAGTLLPHRRPEVLDLLDELDSIRPDLGHASAQEGVDAALAAACSVLERWR